MPGLPEKVEKLEEAAVRQRLISFLLGVLSGITVEDFSSLPTDELESLKDSLTE